MTSCHRVVVCPPIARRALIIPPAPDYVDMPVIAVTELHHVTRHGVRNTVTNNPLKVRSSRVIVLSNHKYCRDCIVHTHTHMRLYIIMLIT